MRKLYLIGILFLLCFSLLSQSDSVPGSARRPDSVLSRDSLKFYKRLYDLASKRNVTHFLYAAVFKDPPPDRDKISPSISSKTNPGKPVSDTKYKAFQGKTIESIYIIILDPLGKVIDDTIMLPGNFLSRAGNSLHVKSRRFVIRNKLLFTEGDTFDSLKVSESERIIHQSPGIREARISVLKSGTDLEAINILILVRDYWSINGELIANISSNLLSASDNNFLGYSHLIQNRISYSLNNPNSLTLNGSYTISNIRSSFISANLYYTFSSLYKNIGLSLDRPFISPLTKWAGGLNLNPVHTFWINTVDGRTSSAPLNFCTKDLWLGRSFALKKGNFHSWNDPRLVLTARLYDTHYSLRPELTYDGLFKNQNSTFYLVGIGFCSRSYYKDVNIYRFGRTENVPEGRLISFTGGYQKSELFSQLYYGAKIAGARHIPAKGYLSELIEYGTFLQNSTRTHGVLNAELKFLSDPLKFSDWSVRAFADLKSTLGFNRDPGEGINLNGENGLTGFNSEVLNGNCKSVVNLALVFYSPYKFMEFHFAGILFTGVGRLSSSPQSLAYGPVYQTYGLGLLIRNENLVLSTIQISLNYYPQIPGKNPNSFQFNPSSIPDIRFNDFYLSKADVAAYQ